MCIQLMSMTDLQRRSIGLWPTPHLEKHPAPHTMLQRRKRRECSARYTRTLGNRPKRAVSMLCQCAFPRLWCASPKTNLVIFSPLFFIHLGSHQATSLGITPKCFKFFPFSTSSCCGRRYPCTVLELSKISHFNLSSLFFSSPHFYLLYNLPFRFCNICSLYLYVVYLL